MPIYKETMKKTIRNVGQLKKAIADLPDSLKVRGSFNEIQEAIVWQNENNARDKYLHFQDKD